jgi:membrane protein implicated in regulation of membrane protease activity
MEDWVWWMIAAGGLAVGEILTLGFFMGPIAVAAVVAAGAALVGFGTPVQLLVFILVALASVGVLRPVARRHLRTPPRAPRRCRAPRPWCSSRWTSTAGR